MQQQFLVHPHLAQSIAGLQVGAAVVVGVDSQFRDQQRQPEPFGQVRPAGIDTGIGTTPGVERDGADVLDRLGISRGRGGEADAAGTGAVAEEQLGLQAPLGEVAPRNLMMSRCSSGVINTITPMLDSLKLKSSGSTP